MLINSIKTLLLLVIFFSHGLVLANECIKLIVPAYYYPNTNHWKKSSIKGLGGGVMIMNPASGPGYEKNIDYEKGIRTARKNGVIVYSYVATDYGKKSSAMVKEEILKYHNWYEVQGVFFDETSSSANEVPYYKMLVEFVRQQGIDRVILNPGVTPDEKYLSEVLTKANDMVVIFEGALTDYSNWKEPDWVKKYPKAKFSHLVYAVPEKSWKDIWEKSKKHWVGFLYLTDDILNNPWDTLPTYWEGITKKVC